MSLENIYITHYCILPFFRTLLKECPFHIQVRTSEDGQKLIITHIDENETHSHEITKEVFQCSAKQRRLTTDEVQEVQGMIGLKANQKLIKEHLWQIKGKKVILKDKHNASKQKQNVNFSEVISELTRLCNTEVEVLLDDSNMVRAIFPTRQSSYR